MPFWFWALSFVPLVLAMAVLAATVAYLFRRQRVEWWHFPLLSGIQAAAQGLVGTISLLKQSVPFTVSFVQQLVLFAISWLLLWVMMVAFHLYFTRKNRANDGRP